MKIKMISCAVTNENLAYNYGMVLTVGKEIDEKRAKEFIDTNFAVLVNEPIKEPIEVPVEEPAETPDEVTQKPKRGRKKKGDSHEV